GSVTLGTATLTTGSDNTSTTFSGTISGTGGLTKIGTGALTLTGVSSYTGATAVNAGTLVVNGSIANSAVTGESGRHAARHRQHRRAHGRQRRHALARQLDRHVHGERQSSDDRGRELPRRDFPDQCRPH